MAMNLGQGPSGTETASIPRWQKDLGLKPDDPVVPKLTAISGQFGDLKLPLPFLSPDRQKAAVRRFHLREAEPDSSPDFTYGIDYFFGKNDGSPEGVVQNAKTAFFQGKKGVELWRVMKSVAFATPDNKIIIAHVRGDREIDNAALADRLGIQETDLSMADVSALGVGYGTVNPFVQHPSVEHVFDRDLVDGTDYPGDDTVMTSSGDPRYYVGFDVRNYIRAYKKTSAAMGSSEISVPDAESQRVVARRPITIIGGDSTVDSAKFGMQVAASVTKKLGESVSYENFSSYWGDRSLPPIDVTSDPILAGSIDTASYGDALRVRATQIAERFRNVSSAENKPKPIVTFSSMAMHGIAGPLLRELKDVEYIGPQEALGPLLARLGKQNVEITHTVLLGLPSAYEQERSAFAGEVLNNALRLDENARRPIHEFIQESKTGKSDPKKFYDVVRRVLGQAAKAPIESFQNKNIAIILGASELEGSVKALEEYAGTDTPTKKLRENFVIIKSNDPATIATDIAKAPKDKIRLILIQPGQAVADMIAQKTLGEA